MQNKNLSSPFDVKCSGIVKLKRRGRLRMPWVMAAVFLLVPFQAWAQQKSSPGLNGTGGGTTAALATHKAPEAFANTPADVVNVTAGPPFVSEAVLSERDFPFLTALQSDRTMRRLLAADSELEAIAQSRWSAAREANLNCKNVACKSAALTFSSAQIEQVTESLSRLYKHDAAVRHFVQSTLQPREIYTLHPNDSEEQLFLGSWEHSAQAMNQIIATYCDGVPSRYSQIDSMIYRPDSRTFVALVGVILNGLPLEESGEKSSEGSTTSSRDRLSQTLFFEPSLRFSMRLLEANMRDEAGRFWPLATGENAPAIQHISDIDWTKYRYSVLLVPGEGPSTYNIRLSPWGKERLRRAVAAYHAGMAPIFLLSGGFVHPSRTSFSEAIEMKKYLEQAYGIAPRAILVDPYARHTTTNLRNAAREIFDYRLPTDRPMLIVSDPLQTDYIVSDGFHKRNLDELGYMPVIFGERLSNSRLEAMPVHTSEFRDPRDPLDP